MAKADGVGFEWDTMWAAFKGQPLYIQQGWMTGKDTHGTKGLLPVLTEIMERYPKRIQDEVFEFAPPDVQRYFGYVPEGKEDKKEKNVTNKVTFMSSYQNMGLSQTELEKLDRILRS